MPSVTATALSGLNAANTRLNASASNIANTQNAEARRLRVEATEQPGGGVRAEIQRDPRVIAAYLGEESVPAAAKA